MKKNKICILGNSIPLLIQPFRANTSEKTYAEYFENKDFTVINGSKEATMVSDLYYYLEDECIRHFPDYVIMHFGIVESTYRARPRWLQNFFSMNAWNNSVIHRGYNGLFTRSIKFLLKKLYKPTIEKLLFVLGLKWRWLSPAHFTFITKDIIKRIFADTPAKQIFLIGMLHPNERFEASAPGTSKSIKEYNSTLSTIASLSPNIIYIDLQDLLLRSSQNSFSHDSMHLTANGHKVLFEKLEQSLAAERTDYTSWQKIKVFGKLYRFYEYRIKRKISRPE